MKNICTLKEMGRVEIDPERSWTKWASFLRSNKKAKPQHIREKEHDQPNLLK
jgi:hypothetical protein